MQDAEGGRSELNAAIVSRLKNALQERGVSEDKLKDAKAVEKEAKDAVTKATAAQLSWKARRLFFQGALVAVVEAGKADSDTLNAIKDKVLEQEIPGEKDSAGKPVKVRDVLKSDFKDISATSLQGLIEKYTFGQFRPSDQPGIAITIFSLGTDLADAQLKRAQADKDYFDQQIVLLTSAGSKSVAMVRAFNKDVEFPLIEKPEFRLEADDTPLATIQKILDLKDEDLEREQGQKALEIKGKGVQSVLKLVARYSVAYALDDPQSDNLGLLVRLSRLEHERSIQLSMVNAAEQEAVIGRGLQALDTYHQGGITSEQTANLIRALQTAALAWIGAGVD
jgi:hypothetical protein